MLRSRRRPHYGAYMCALTAAVLLLFSVALLYSRLTVSRDHLQSGFGSSNDLFTDTILDDPDFGSGSTDEDRIDEHDIIINEDNEQSRVSDEDGEDDDSGYRGQSNGVSRYFFDHVGGVIRRAFDKRSIDDWQDYISFEAAVILGVEDKSKSIFGSDDVPVDEEVRRKIGEVSGVEDALLLKSPGRKVSPLREGWGKWFDAKSDFLRRDRMFKSNLELLNPLNNPLLQDPDGTGVIGLTRGDKLLQKDILNQFKKVPFNPLNTKQLLRNTRSTAQELDKHMSADENSIEKINNGKNELLDGVDMKAKIVWTERKTLDHSYHGDLPFTKNVDAFDRALGKSFDQNLVVKNGDTYGRNIMHMTGKSGLGDVDSKGSKSQIKSENAKHIYADGKRWGYFPGLHPHLSFSKFMDNFFRKGKCSLRVFMVWNSPPWMFSLRLKRSFETLLLQHQQACVVVFSETVELDFFEEFVKEGFKVSVAMPNLDELLKSTPAEVFASVWFEWRTTKFYSTHYSELVRLAALYKYGGIYLDSDVLVLKPLSSLNNSIGHEDTDPQSSLSGAVMAFRRHGPFIMECLKEFRSTYDETKLRWNGAELLSRAAKKFLAEENILNKQAELYVLPSSTFSPVSRSNITRYFNAPTTEEEKHQHDRLFEKIMNESFTFHLWNSDTFSLLPEPQSLVARLIGHSCIHCSDVL